jgi:hypothetical protein
MSGLCLLWQLVCVSDSELTSSSRRLELVSKSHHRCFFVTLTQHPTTFLVQNPSLLRIEPTESKYAGQKRLPSIIAEECRNAEESMRFPLKFTWCPRHQSLKTRRSFWRRFEASIVKKHETLLDEVFLLVLLAASYRKRLHTRSLLSSTNDVSFIIVPRVSLLSPYDHLRSIFKSHSNPYNSKSQ